VIDKHSDHYQRFTDHLGQERFSFVAGRCTTFVHQLSTDQPGQARIEEYAQRQQQQNQHSVYGAKNQSPPPGCAADSQAPQKSVDQGKNDAHHEVDRATQRNCRLLVGSSYRAQYADDVYVG